MLTLYRIGHWIMFVCHIYLAWSRLYRWLWHRKYRVLAPSFPRLSMEQAQEWMHDGLRWKRDSIRALWDAVGDPHRVQAILDGKA